MKKSQLTIRNRRSGTIKRRAVHAARALVVFLAAQTIGVGAPASAAAALKEFTIRSGALVEAIYFKPNTAAQVRKAMPAYAQTIAENGGERLADFEVLKVAKGDHQVGSVTLIQWPEAAARSSAARSQAFKDLSGSIADIGFYGVEQDTPVVLLKDKVYDLTSAWTIATDPSQMPVLMQILGEYFQKITPALQKYEITQKAFFGPHPGAPKTESPIYAPQMFGIFEWRSVKDYPKFNNDPMFTEHVDIRDAMMKKMETLLTRATW